MGLFTKARRQPSRPMGSRKPRRGGLEALEGRYLMAHDVLAAAQVSSNRSAALEIDFYRPPHVFHSAASELLGTTSETASLEAGPLEIALDYLHSHAADYGLRATDLAHYRVSDQYVSQHTGTTHVYLRQQHHGLDVMHADINVNVSAKGHVIAAGSSFLTGLNPASAALPSDSDSLADGLPKTSPSDALHALAGHFGWEIHRSPRAPLPLDVKARSPAVFPTSNDFTSPNESATVDFVWDGDPVTVLPPSGVSREPIPTQLRYVPRPDGGVELGWGMIVQTEDGQHWYDATISARNGELLYATDWASHASYNVYASPNEGPNDGPRTIQTDVADATASPLGWHDTDPRDGLGEFSITRGNNVYAQEDREGFDGIGFSPDGGETLEFDFPIDFADHPSGSEHAAITNLFYQSNVLHDIHFLYGFDEAAGNFQDTNFTGLGLGNDAIRADAQDGFDTDNAAFFATPDGIAPRMQMGEWRGATFLSVHGPMNIADEWDASPAIFGPPLDDDGTSGEVVISSPMDGCSALTNSNEIAGNIALIERGDCFFTEKVHFAQQAGASAVIITNNEPDGLVTMAGENDAIEIPSLMVTLGHGDALRAALRAGQTVDVTLTGNPNRDSSLDNGVIIHEYGHGVSTRLVGGPSNASSLDATQSGGLGEGWSDWWALMLTQSADDSQFDPYSIGVYLTGGSPEGIRRFPYSFDMSVNPLTFDDLDPQKADVSCPSSCGEVHNAGEVWAAALWDLNWLMINGDGASIPAQGFDADFYRGTGGNNVALQLVMDGMKLLPSNPTFLEARDGILTADLALTGGSNQYAIWTAFARRGMGFSASAITSANSIQVSEAFDIPNLARDAQWLGDDAGGDGIHWDDANNWVVDSEDNELPSPIAPGDDVILKTASTVMTIEIGEQRLANSVSFEAGFVITGGTLSITNGQINVDPNVFATIDADLVSSNRVTKVGEGTLVIRGNAAEVSVDGGTLIVASTAMIDNLAIQNNSTVILNGRVGNLTNSGQLFDAGDFDGDGSYSANDIDLLYVRLGGGVPFDPRFDLVSDGVIDDLDLDDLVLARIGTTFGDADVNGIVDADDFEIWRANQFTADSTLR